MKMNVKFLLFYEIIYIIQLINKKITFINFVQALSVSLSFSLWFTLLSDIFFLYWEFISFSVGEELFESILDFGGVIKFVSNEGSLLLLLLFLNTFLYNSKSSLSIVSVS